MYSSDKSEKVWDCNIKRGWQESLPAPSGDWFSLLVGAAISAICTIGYVVTLTFIIRKLVE